MLEEKAKELGRMIDGAEIHLLDRGGHFCPIAATEAYNAKVLGFLMGEGGHVGG